MIVTISLKPIGGAPGDATSDQMRALAEIAQHYSYNELRVSHEQNIVLPHVHRADLAAVHAALDAAGLATPNAGLVSDIIACPGMDFCSLATGRSIPIAQQIGRIFANLDAQRRIGPLKIKISGCINSCGHHHVAHFGLLGLYRAGVENYQITLGGDASETAARRDMTAFETDAAGRVRGQSVSLLDAYRYRPTHHASRSPPPPPCVPGLSLYRLLALHHPSRAW